VARTFHPLRRDPATGAEVASDVDDAFAFVATLAGGALATFEVSRVAAPHLNANAIELDGDAGSLRFEFEDMNVLRFHDAADGPREGGWRRIVCTSAGNHPYAAHWWPDAHLLGYEHGFTNQLADVLAVLAGRDPELPLADFADAYETQRVLEAALRSAREGHAVPLAGVHG
ncbi:MAG TPA: Gfo/Idh/MocA family oxidoreductase, partial [Planctomycetota bacterium]|nr:Gfo/Idh/MocA family oxidoreductase [Planctomycetota bacterium]